MLHCAVDIKKEEERRKLTAFGKFCRKLRIDKNELLRDMAKKLKVTSSYLSAVEMGKRSIPKSWAGIIRREYGLNSNQFKELLRAIELSQPSIKIDLTNYDESDRELILAFVSQFSSLDDDTKHYIKILLNKCN